jgi:D-alanyl-D-alanine carboxypeptidase
MCADDRLTQQMDALVEREYSAENPGAVILLMRGTKILYRRAVGMADLEMRVPMAPEMVFRIASLTKPITAQAILLLAEQGKLKLDDPLEMYFPGNPTFAAIRLEHLLTHTSGLVNYTDLPEWWAIHRQDVTTAEIIGLIKDRPLVSPPGSVWAYNNSGYYVLGALIELLTGASFGAYLEERIFRPLRLQRTCYEDAARVIPDRVRGYQKAAGAFQNPEPISVTQVFSAGGLLSCADDLARWGSALFAGEVLHPESWRLATLAFVLADGKPSSYGCGWFLSQERGVPLVGHLGSLPGFAHYLVGAPSQRLIAIVLSNLASGLIVPEPLARAILSLALE